MAGSQLYFETSANKIIILIRWEIQRKDSWRLLFQKGWYQSSRKNQPQPLTHWFTNLEIPQKCSQTQILESHSPGTEGDSLEMCPETCSFKPLPRWSWGSVSLGWHWESLYLALILTPRTWVLRAPERGQYHTSPADEDLQAWERGVWPS